ncbi:hypothetical protein [uncultured Clostridium sp.]|uniref:hypothetical protein n=1 Tax=uncultured Clostridium sp. TaxID=59620 RepID=UPI00261C480E|nr:hypothetical protein [uncultured Clostridium sp.]
MEALKIKDMVLKIMNAAIEKTVCTPNDVMVNFMGHVMSLTVSVYLGKENLFYRNLYLQKPFEEYKPDKPILEELKEILDYINQL